jgi:hypothetical protein
LCRVVKVLKDPQNLVYTTPFLTLSPPLYLILGCFYVA